MEATCQATATQGRTQAPGWDMQLEHKVMSTYVHCHSHGNLRV